MDLNIQPGQTALITTSQWFLAPDGKEYRAVFGTVHAIRDDKTTLGIASNRNSTNWYIEIGCMTIAGCQVHYAVRCQGFNENAAEAWTADSDKGIHIYERPCLIFNADTPAACA